MTSGTRAGDAPARSIGNATVDVVIVNWNGGSDVLRAAQSAIAFGGRAIVVDNGSVDGSADAVADRLPSATVICLGYNSGFAHAANVGVAAGAAPHVLLLNPDAEIVQGTADDLVGAFSMAPDVMIVGPATLDTSGRPTRSVRRFPTLPALVLYQLKLHPFRRWIPPLRDYFMLDFQATTPSRVDQVIGAAFAMRRSDWQRFGGLDEGYFLLFEEVDLSRRVADAGGSSIFLPTVVVRHTGATSFRRLKRVRLQRYWNTSLLRYARRHLGRRATAVLAMTVPISIAISAVLDMSSLLGRNVLARHRARKASG